MPKINKNQFYLASFALALHAARTNHETMSTAYAVGRLTYIGKRLHSLYTAACNYDLSQRQETRRDNLEAEVDAIAADLGVTLAHQRDPRGLPIKLIVDGQNESGCPIL